MMFVKDKEKVRKPGQSESEITYINDEVQIIGCFAVPHNLVLLGNIKGDVVVKGDLIIGKSAAIIGNVYCKSATIDGILNGNITCEKKLTVNEGGQILGDITAEDFLSYGKVNIAGKINISNNGTYISENYENLVSKMLNDAKSGKSENRKSGADEKNFAYESHNLNNGSSVFYASEIPASSADGNSADARKSNPWA